MTDKGERQQTVRLRAAPRVWGFAANARVQLLSSESGFRGIFRNRRVPTFPLGDYLHETWDSHKFPYLVWENAAESRNPSTPPKARYSCQPVLDFHGQDTTTSGDSTSEIYNTALPCAVPYYALP